MEISIAIRGSNANSQAIIDYFISLGASNPCNMKGWIDTRYYFVNCANEIDNMSDRLAEQLKHRGYTLYETMPNTANTNG